MPSERLTHVEIRNLRRHRRLSVPLAPATVLLGHNNVGKSAVMDALGLLANLSRHSPFTFSSYAKFTYQALAHPTGEHVHCGIGFESSDSAHTGEYAISFRATAPPTTYLDVISESLDIDGASLFSRSNDTPSGSVAAALRPYLANASFFGALSMGRRRLSSTVLTIPPLVDDMSFFFRAIGQYRMVTNFIADPGNSTPVQGAFPSVNRQGVGLTALLIYLQEFEPESFDCITHDLASAIDGFEGFEFSPAAQPQESEFRVRFRDSRGPIPAPQLSDGTLNLIGLTTVLRSPRQFRFLCLEEPELGLTPKSIQHLVKTLSEGPTALGLTRPQMMITTHSPFLVASLLDQFTTIRQRDDLSVLVVANDPDQDSTIVEPLEAVADECGYDPMFELQPEHIALVMRGLLS